MLNRILLGIAIAATTFYSRDIDAQIAISTAGGDAYSSAGSFSFTVGQTAYTYFQNENLDLELGVQHAYAIQQLEASEERSTAIVKVFPNPTSDELIISIHDNELPVHIRVFSSSGELVLIRSFQSAGPRISLSSLSSGVYFLHLAVEHEQPRVFRIVKS